MKRTAILQLGIILVILMLTGCGSNNIKNQDENKDNIVEETLDEEMSTAVYDEVLQRFYKNAVNADVEALFESGEFTSLAEVLQYQDSNTVLQSFGYSYKDINSDGITELIIGNIREVDNGKSYGDIICNLYTYVDGEVVCLINGYAKNVYRMFEDGKIYNSGVGGAIYYCSGIFDLSPESGTLECLDFYITHERDDDFADIAVYRNHTGSWSPEDSTETDMTVDDFFAMDEEYIQKVVDIELIPFTEYEKSAG